MKLMLSLSFSLSVVTLLLLVGASKAQNPVFAGNFTYSGCGLQTFWDPTINDYGVTTGFDIEPASISSGSNLVLCWQPEGTARPEGSPHENLVQSFSITYNHQGGWPDEYKVTFFHPINCVSEVDYLGVDTDPETGCISAATRKMSTDIYGAVAVVEASLSIWSNEAGCLKTEEELDAMTQDADGYRNKICDGVPLISAGPSWNSPAQTLTQNWMITGPSTANGLSRYDPHGLVPCNTVNCIFEGDKEIGYPLRLEAMWYSISAQTATSSSTPELRKAAFVVRSVNDIGSPDAFVMKNYDDEYTLYLENERVFDSRENNATENEAMLQVAVSEWPYDTLADLTGALAGLSNGRFVDPVLPFCTVFPNGTCLLSPNEENGIGTDDYLPMVPLPATYAPVGAPVVDDDGGSDDALLLPPTATDEPVVDDENGIDDDLLLPPVVEDVVHDDEYVDDDVVAMQNRYTSCYGGPAERWTSATNTTFPSSLPQNATPTSTIMTSLIDHQYTFAFVSGDVKVVDGVNIFDGYCWNPALSMMNNETATNTSTVGQYYEIQYEVQGSPASYSQGESSTHVVIFAAMGCVPDFTLYEDTNSPCVSKALRYLGKLPPKDVDGGNNNTTTHARYAFVWVSQHSNTPEDQENNCAKNASGVDTLIQDARAYEGMECDDGKVMEVGDSNATSTTTLGVSGPSSSLYDASSLLWNHLLLPMSLDDDAQQAKDQFHWLIFPPFGMSASDACETPNCAFEAQSIVLQTGIYLSYSPNHVNATLPIPELPLSITREKLDPTLQPIVLAIVPLSNDTSFVDKDFAAIGVAPETTWWLCDYPEEDASLFAGMIVSNNDGRNRFPVELSRDSWPYQESLQDFIDAFSMGGEALSQLMDDETSNNENFTNRTFCTIASDGACLLVIEPEEEETTSPDTAPPTAKPSEEPSKASEPFPLGGPDDSDPLNIEELSAAARLPSTVRSALLIGISFAMLVTP